MAFGVEWRLVGREGQHIDQGEIEGDFPDRPSALRALHAYLLTFQVTGRNSDGGWWGRRSSDADIEVQVFLRESAEIAPGLESNMSGPVCRANPSQEEGNMTSEELALLRKAAADPYGQISLKRSHTEGWQGDLDRLRQLATQGHVLSKGERMGPHIRGTFAIWQITPAGRAIVEQPSAASH